MLPFHWRWFASFPWLVPGSCNTCLKGWFSSVGWKHLSECCFPGRDADLRSWSDVCWSTLPEVLHLPLSSRPHEFLCTTWNLTCQERSPSSTSHHVSVICISTIFQYFMSRTLRLFLTPLCPYAVHYGSYWPHFLLLKKSVSSEHLK